MSVPGRSILSGFCLLLLWATCLSGRAADRPNVVLIMTDNHGAWTLGCYGNRDIRTPHIDRLASEGVLFTRAFASNPVCSPTRATFLTGLLPSQHGVHSFLSAGNLQVGPHARCTLDRITSLPEVLRGAGYRCGLVGKWHLGDNLRPQEGLDEYWITMPHGGTSTFYDADIIEAGEIRKEPEYLTDFWTRHAVRFIDQRADGGDPFFLFLAYNGPYALGRLLLRDGQNRHAAYYADKPLDSFPRQPPHPWQLNNRDFLNNPTSIRRVATEISGIDDGVGEVLAALRRNTIEENTIVIFVADQGWVGGHGGFFGMGDHTQPLTARDGMMRIPTIWRQPGRIGRGLQSNRMISNYDLMPTLLAQVGLADRMPVAPASPGRDYSAALTGNEFASADPQDAVYYEFENLRCVRTATHKYVHRHPNGPHELYDLQQDPEEFVNLAEQPEHRQLADSLREKLFRFYRRHAEPQYDLWNGGTSQVRLHRGIDDEIPKPEPAEPPPTSPGFEPAPIDVPDGFSVELAAAPPLVTHPTMACFDPRGRLYVCNNAGVNMTDKQLEANLPNAIHLLTDTDQDGRFDKSTVFADQMTFPMGGTWLNGSLYVASPPNIWRLTDTDDDGVADERTAIVKKFGYNGNAASIHGCFAGPDGRLYWTDGYHGHEFSDESGSITSRREGSYLFSCRPDGSDTRIHCGGGMDNPVEIDFTDSGDLIGTVNILYSRPRVDALVHWLYGGVYPHREKVLDEVQITGEWLGPIHRFGHVAVSGLTRYRSGAIDHRWNDHFFTTFFNLGRVARLQLRNDGSTYQAQSHEFLSSSSRDFHPTDVLEDADGSLLVIDTGGWFYRGCPTSQLSKPEVLGGIYRIRRDGMTSQVDPRGLQIDWPAQSDTQLVRLFNDTRFEVRQQAINELARRGKPSLPVLRQQLRRADVRIRLNAVWAIARMLHWQTADESVAEMLETSLPDRSATIRQAACRAIDNFGPASLNAPLAERLKDNHPAVRRTAAMVLGRRDDPSVVPRLLAALNETIDRSEQHAITYAMIELNDAQAILRAWQSLPQPNAVQSASVITAIDQIDPASLDPGDVFPFLTAGDESLRQAALRIVTSRRDWDNRILRWLSERVGDPQTFAAVPTALLARFISEPRIGEPVGRYLRQTERPELRKKLLTAIANAEAVSPNHDWIDPLQRMLDEPDTTVATMALSAVTRIEGSQFDAKVLKIASDPGRAADVRAAALRSIAARSADLDPAVFAMLQEMIREPAEAVVADQAAEVLASARLNDSQLIEITRLIGRVTATQLKSLLQAFARTRSEPVINAFLDSVAAADALLTLTENDFSEVVKRFPAAVLPRVNELLAQLRRHEQQKIWKLEGLRELIGQGDVGRGKQVFQSEKAKCSSCHRVGQRGQRVGPDLTTIGANRSVDDLLESIVFPSASIVRDYGTYKLLTVDGRVLSGLLVRETGQHYTIQQASGEPIEIDRERVESLQASDVSLMPGGLDEALTEAELADVVVYLKSLR